MSPMCTLSTNDPLLEESVEIYPYLFDLPRSILDRGQIRYTISSPDQLLSFVLGILFYGLQICVYRQVIINIIKLSLAPQPSSIIAIPSPTKDLRHLDLCKRDYRRTEQSINRYSYYTKKYLRTWTSKAAIASDSVPGSPGQIVAYTPTFYGLSMP
ncbi:uncharacterized protein EV420DRAFT_357707 [Desarmillaria tabescens]|uniref:Uncharacterized protein n=1 Tax=Armillaria tabescens TaxID=1929756 RepID=A0AA39N5B3_ARMTA|nr:uncharacterized protein EV420DRAFT_357707 [Desarmillaria tabescens]KAK0458477.1 hypothetical protein EV420DRAFT_357707 [Desarmillaria tabescens]